MICLNCKKQIPDDSNKCPHCGNEVSHKHQVGKEISFRRWQRWGFYGLLVLLFLGMLAITIKFYSSNNKILLQMANVRGDLESKSEALDKAREEIRRKQQEYEDIKKQLEKENKQLKRDLSLESEKLTIKTSEHAKQMREKKEVRNDYEQCLLDYSQLSDNYKNLINSIGVGISNADLSRILVADFNLDTATDTDNDGLSDTIEKALGTNDNLMDTDSDGYSDKAEILSGFDPNGGGNMPIDNGFASNNIGRIFIQVENDGQAWFIGKDSKRYFLGKINKKQ